MRSLVVGFIDINSLQVDYPAELLDNNTNLDRDIHKRANGEGAVSYNAASSHISDLKTLRSSRLTKSPSYEFGILLIFATGVSTTDTFPVQLKYSTPSGPNVCSVTT